MAAAPGHTFGGRIGDIVELALEPALRQFAEQHGLYLDRKAPRAARNGRKKVTWIDDKGNAHELDFVLERGGTPDKFGDPVAFIESAFRSYTKHSRNKVQEIQGAVMPLVESHGRAAPFIGVMLAGMWTDGSKTQLQSLGFKLLVFSQADVANAFRTVGVDTEWQEGTSDEELLRRVNAVKELTTTQRAQVCAALLGQRPDDVAIFMEALKASITRQVTYVRVTPLHGLVREWQSIEQAIEFVDHYVEGEISRPFARYEVELHYSNGDELRGRFRDKTDAITYLRSFLPTTAEPATQ